MHAAQDPGRAPETLLGARRPVSGLFRCITGKASYFSQRRWTADSDGSLHTPLPGTTPIQTACPAATARPPTPTGSCRICAAGASAASAGERPRRPAARFLWSHATAGSFSQQGRVALPGSSARCHPLEQTWARRGGRGVPRDSVRWRPACATARHHMKLHIILSTSLFPRSRRYRLEKLTSRDEIQSRRF